MPLLLRSLHFLLPYSAFARSFLHHFKLLAVYAGYGDAHATHVHHEAAVAVYSDDVTFNAGEEAGSEAQLGVAAGIIFEWMEEKADAFGGSLQYAHERLHHAVGYDGRLMCAAIIHKVIVRKSVVEVLLQLLRCALQENKAAYGRLFDGLNAASMFVTQVFYCFVDKVPYPVFFKPFRK